MKLMTNTNTLRLRTGNFLTKSILFSTEDEAARQVLYCCIGTMGDSSSRNHILNNDAATCGSSIPCYLISYYRYYE
jgi:hypothetical protein